MSERDKVLSAPMEVHWGSDTTLQQVPGISTSDISGISLYQRSLTAILKISFTEINREHPNCGELLFRYSTQQETQCLGLFSECREDKKRVHYLFLSQSKQKHPQVQISKTFESNRCIFPRGNKRAL